MVPLGEQQMRVVFNFHAGLVLRHLRASSLPMRLWGWEQTEELIALSHKHRWNVKAYLVRMENEAFSGRDMGLAELCTS